MAHSRSAGSLAGGVILIGLGLLYLAGQLLAVDIMERAWPFFVLGIGGLFFVGMLLGGPQARRLAIPGAILSTVGAILLMQNTFGYWETWSYAWTLIVSSVGAGLFISGWWGHDELARQRGVRIVLLGAVLFLVFGGFFEVALGFSGFGVGAQILWAGGMILMGLFLVLRSSGLFGRPQ